MIIASLLSLPRKIGLAVHKSCVSQSRVHSEVITIINVYEGVMEVSISGSTCSAAYAVSRRCMRFMTEHTASVREYGSGKAPPARRILHINCCVSRPRIRSPPPSDTQGEWALAGASPHLLTADRLPPAPPLSVPTAAEAAAVGPALGPSRLGPLSWDPAVLALLAGGGPLQLPPFLQALTQPPAPPQSLPDTVPLTVSVPLRPYQPGMGMPTPAPLTAEDGPRQPAEASRADVKPDPASGLSTGFYGAEEPRYPSPSSGTGSAASPAPPAVPNPAAPRPSNKTSYLEKNRMAQVCAHCPLAVLCTFPVRQLLHSLPPPGLHYLMTLLSRGRIEHAYDAACCRHCSIASTRPGSSDPALLCVAARLIAKTDLPRSHTGAVQGASEG